jgi:hypothetical protein
MADGGPGLASSRPSNGILGLPLLAAAMLLPLWIGYEGARVFWIARERAARYLPVEATVLATSVDSRRSLRGGVSYLPRVRYRYVVDGTAYHSDRTTLMDLSSTRGWAEEIAGRFHPSGMVKAYYDPLQPDQAYLLATTGGLPYGLLAFCVLWEGGAVWLFRRWLRGPVGTG